jgi:hypothetical protein
LGPYLRQAFVLGHVDRKPCLTLRTRSSKKDSFPLAFLHHSLEYKSLPRHSFFKNFYRRAKMEHFKSIYQLLETKLIHWHGGGLE